MKILQVNTLNNNKKIYAIFIPDQNKAARNFMCQKLLKMRAAQQLQYRIMCKKENDIMLEIKFNT